MMQKLKEEITAAANRELNRANEQFPLFTSKHEGVAVAYEELEESKEALEELETSFKCLWDDLSKNRIEELRVIRENREAENAILSKLLIPPLCGDESRAEETESEGTQHDADGSSTEDKRTE